MIKTLFPAVHEQSSSSFTPHKSSTDGNVASDGAATISNTGTPHPVKHKTELFVLTRHAAAVAVSLLGSVTGLHAQVAQQKSQLQFKQQHYTGAEPTTGTTTYKVLVSRTGDATGAVEVKVKTTNGTATSGIDYDPLDQTLTWAAGDSADKEVSITVKKDADNTAADTFNLMLSGAVAQGTAATHTVELGSRTTAVFTITEKADSTGPVVKILSPRSNASVSANGLATVALEASALDPVGVNSVVVRVNGRASIPLTKENSTYKANLTGLDNGKNTIEVVATDAQGNMGRTSIFVNAYIGNATQVGTYNGLFVAEAGQDAILANMINGPALNHNGLLRIDVTTGNRFTGTVSMAGVRTAIKGLFLADGTAVFGDGTSASQNFELLKPGVPDDFSLGFLSLKMVAKKITGSLTTDPNQTNPITFASVSADQSLYTDRSTPASPFMNVPSSIVGTADGGNYTVLFQKGTAPNNGYAASAYPMGDGAGTIVVGKNGVVKLAARLADGTAFSYSNALSPENYLPMYVSLYANKGLLTGNVLFSPSDATTDAKATVSWFRPNRVKTTGNYPSGWMKGISLDLIASKYVKPASGATNNVLNLAPATNFTFRTEGALGTTSNQGMISAANVVTIGNASAGMTTTAGLRMTLDTKTGLLKAPSEFLYGSGKVKVGLFGAVFQKTRSVQGHFLYAPARINPVGTPESGSFKVSSPIP